MPSIKSVLDQDDTYLKLDSQNIYESVLGLRDQLAQAWLEASTQAVNQGCQLSKNIVIAGMGGSALGGRIIRSLDQYILNVPLEVVTNYRLPSYVNQDTLVVLVSYSGGTEEIVSCLYDAQKRSAKVFVVASGGKLADLATKNSFDRYIFTPKFNPSNQPRMGLGYSIAAILAILSRCHFINFAKKDVEEIDGLLDTLTPTFSKEKKLELNPAKSLAVKLKNKGIILISANHLVGVTHAIKNMFNENSKTFAAHFDLPELNHHFLEGLTFPQSVRDSLHFILINSSLYPQIIQNRLRITKQLIEKSGYLTTTVKAEASNPTLQAFETLYFGEFLSFYLALVNQVDPGPIPSVDYLKTQLEKI